MSELQLLIYYAPKFHPSYYQPLCNMRCKRRMNLKAQQLVKSIRIDLNNALFKANYMILYDVRNTRELREKMNLSKSRANSNKESYDIGFKITSQ